MNQTEEKSIDLSNILQDEMIFRYFLINGNHLINIDTCIPYFRSYYIEFLCSILNDCKFLLSYNNRMTLTVSDILYIFSLKKYNSLHIYGYDSDIMILSNQSYYISELMNMNLLFNHDKNNNKSIDFFDNYINQVDEIIDNDNSSNNDNNNDNEIYDSNDEDDDSDISVDTEDENDSIDHLNNNHYLKIYEKKINDFNISKSFLDELKYAENIVKKEYESYIKNEIFINETNESIKQDEDSELIYGEGYCSDKEIPSGINFWKNLASYWERKLFNFNYISNDVTTMNIINVKENENKIFDMVALDTNKISKDHLLKLDFPPYIFSRNEFYKIVKYYFHNKITSAALSALHNGIEKKILNELKYPKGDLGLFLEEEKKRFLVEKEKYNIFINNKLIKDENEKLKLEILEMKNIIINMKNQLLEINSVGGNIKKKRKSIEITPDMEMVDENCNNINITLDKSDIKQKNVDVDKRNDGSITCFSNFRNRLSRKVKPM